MDSYEASQSLANDLLSAADSSVFRSHLDTNRGDTLGHTGDILNEYGRLLSCIEVLIKAGRGSGQKKNLR